VGVVDRFYFRAIWRSTHRRNLQRIRTAALTDREEAALCFGRIDEALTLLDKSDPITLARLRKYCDGILVFGTETFRLAHWNKSARLCVITLPHVTSPNTTGADLALTLAHESMHARLGALGARYVEGGRAHLEVLCAMAELASARRLAEPRLVQRTEAKLTRWASEGEEPWSEGSYLEQGLAHLRELGVPDWIVRMTRKARRFVAGTEPGHRETRKGGGV